MYPTRGGAPLRLCERCAPPWGTETMPFYLGWSPDRKFLFWNFSGSMYSIPLPPDRMLPQIPAAGLQSKAAVGALPGARLVTNEPHAFPGPHPSVHVVMKVTAQRNIYRVPVQ